jgi:hypothetical protein
MPPALNLGYCPNLTATIDLQHMIYFCRVDAATTGEYSFAGVEQSVE